ncbi:MAG: SHOCT domain-containing protein [Spirochaetales bacterium]|nr:SHOCT domain-containing protein [Spirochaetales bacterium]
MWGNWGWGMPGYFGWGGWVMGLVMVAVLAVVIVVGIRLVNKTDRSHQHEESALEVLKKRYARGEISQEEYRTMRDELKD